MKATLIAWTHFAAQEASQAATGDEFGYRSDTHGGQALIEFAGRACYESWDKPNPATATNAGYIKHIIDVGHGSVLEHAQATFYITQVSRAFTHELIRHRHFSYSQLSQRFADQTDSNTIMSDAVWNDEKAYAIHAGMALAARDAYQQLMVILEEKYAHVPNATRRRKLARQQARLVLLESTETKIVVTGNFRVWRHFIELRASEHADLEIAEVAVDILRQLQTHAPNVFADYEIKQGEFGEYAVKVDDPGIVVRP
jgi:thymidylate synthase (FAD)